MLELSLRNAVAWAVQVAALGGIGVALPMAFRISSPRLKLRYLRGLLVACLVLPVLQPWPPAPAPVGASLDTSVLAEIPIADGAGASPAAEPSPLAGAWPIRLWLEQLPGHVEYVAAIVLLAGVTARVAWLGLGLLSLARLRRLSVPLDPRPDAVTDAARLVGTDAEFRVSASIVRPVTFGLRRPLVLVPDTFASFEPAQQTAVAAHELIHVARRDWVRTLGDELLLSVLWFHPALWWLVGQIHLSTEQIVDQHVIRLTGSRRPYLEALLKLAAAGPTPMMQPAAPFLKHGHLAQRVALLVREASMSRIRLVASLLVVVALLCGSGWTVVRAFPLVAPAPPTQLLPSEMIPGVIPEVAPAEISPAAPPQPQSAEQVSGQGPGQAAGWQTRPTVDPKAQQARPGMPPPPPPPPPPGAKPVILAPYDVARFEKAVDGLKRLLTTDPANPEVRYTLAVYYWERAYRDSALSEADKRNFVTMGLSEIDQVLQLKPNYMEALIYKNLLLRQQATLEKDSATRQNLIAEADKLRADAMRIKEAQSGWTGIPSNAVRVGGTIKPPAKVKDVRPVYPAVAQGAKVQGVVIIEAVIGEDGRVRAARVMRSIPLLDEAAMEAVRQWEFTPTLLNDAAVPVVMTVTVNFTLSDSSKPAGGDVSGGVVGGVPSGVVGGVPGAPPLPPPPPLPPDTVRVGPGISAPARTLDVKPVYPADAQALRVQGVVIVEVVIGKDGKVMMARVLRSIPLLDQAALDAVLQWEFTPTVVDGVPKNLVMTVTVNFTLQ